MIIDSALMMNDETVTAEERRRQFEEQAIPLTPLLYYKALEFTNRNYFDAEDLVQETFVKAYKSWHQFEQGTNLGAWLTTIMKNTNTNRVTKQAKDVAQRGLEEMEDFQLGNAESVSAQQQLPADVAALQQLSSTEVNEAMRSLAPEFRDVVYWAIVEEKPYAEIAEKLDIPIGTVMSRLHRGKLKLRKALGEYAKSEGYNVEGTK